MNELKKRVDEQTEQIELINLSQNLFESKINLIDLQIAQLVTLNGIRKKIIDGAQTSEILEAMQKQIDEIKNSAQTKIKFNAVLMGESEYKELIDRLNRLESGCYGEKYIQSINDKIDALDRDIGILKNLV